MDATPCPRVVGARSAARAANRAFISAKNQLKRVSVGEVVPRGLQCVQKHLKTAVPKAGRRRVGDARPTPHRYTG